MSETAGLHEDQRDIVLEAVQGERDIILAALQEERQEAMSDAEVLAVRLFDQAEGRVEGAIDHFFVRLAQLLAGVGVAVALGVFAILRSLRRPATA